MNDMNERDVTNTGCSEIARIYEGKTVFLTGATGYLGKMLLEKLLRSCDRLEKIYVLVRNKKDKTLEARYEELLSSQIWETLSRKNPNFVDKLSPMGGDLTMPMLGLDEGDIKIIQKEVNVIMHCAATVRFDEHIKKAVYANVRSVTDLIQIASGVRNLEAFLYVSTAYSNYPKQVIDEVIYEAPISGEDISNLVDNLSEEKLTNITPILLDEWPNTYAFTKAVAEGILERKGNNLPIVVCRPTMVTAAVSEPLAGWVDNFYGPSSVFLACGLGLMRTMLGVRNNLSDMVPADYVINWMIAATAQRMKNRWQAGEHTRTEVYNFCSCAEAPLTWDMFQKKSSISGLKIPSEKLCIWYPTSSALQENIYLHKIYVFFLHYIPGYIIDFVLTIIGREPKAVKLYEKINKLGDTLSNFTTREWNFKNEHTQKLWSKMGKTDRRIFPFTMRNFDWDDYFEIYTKGLRLYILKDPLDTLPEGLRRMFLLKIAYYVTISLFSMVGLLILRSICMFLLF